jgi:hypothetical protein
MRGRATYWDERQHGQAGGYRMRYLRGLLIGTIMIMGIMVMGTRTEAQIGYYPNTIYSSEGWGYINLEGDTIKLVNASKIKPSDDGALTVPEMVDEKQVTVLSEWLFYGRDDIVSITISEGIQEIESKCFLGCVNLETVSLPDTLKSIGSYAFQGCTNLESAYLPAALESIGSYAFQGCTKLENAKSFKGINTNINDYIPKSVTYIGEGAFWNTPLLDMFRELDMRIELVSMENGGTQKITVQPPVIVNNMLLDGRLWYEGSKKVTVPESVTEICSYVFYAPEYSDETKPTPNEYITAVTFANPDTVIDSAAFYGFSGLVGVTLPENLERIESETFKGCSSLKRMEIPDSVTFIGENAFSGCTMLQEVVLPASLETVEKAFVIDPEKDEEEQLWITVPEDLKDVNGLAGLQEIDNIQYAIIYVAEGSDAYYYLKNSKMVNFNLRTYASKYSGSDDETGDEGDNGSGNGTGDEGDNGSGNGTGSESGSGTDNGTGSVSDSNSDNGTGGQDNSTTGNVTQTTTKQKAKVGEIYTVKSIRYKVMSGKKVTCVGTSKKTIKKITIPNSVKILGQTFKVTAIGKGAMKGCKKLTTVKLGSNVKTIKDEAFMNCNKLKTITLGKNVKTIGKKVFYKDKKLKHIIFKGAKISKIGKKSLQGLPKKVKITAPLKAKNKYKKLLKAAK